MHTVSFFTRSSNGNIALSVQGNIWKLNVILDVTYGLLIGQLKARTVTIYTDLSYGLVPPRSPLKDYW